MHGWLHGVCRVIGCLRKRRPGLGLLTVYSGTTQKLPASVLPPLSGTTMKDTGIKENIHSGQNFRQYAWSYTLLIRRNGQMCDYLLKHELWPVVWLDGQGLGRSTIENLVRETFSLEICGQNPPNGQSV